MKHFPGPQGFTLVEIITTLFITGVLSVALSALFVWGMRLWGASDEQARAIEQIRKGYEQTVKEIREMQTASNGAYPIERADAVELIFYVNTDADDERERVRLTLLNETLQKGVIQPVGTPATYPPGTETVTTIAKYVRNTAVFSYYDQSYTGSQNPLSSPVNANLVRLVRISLSIDANPQTPPGAFDLSTNITLRNLKQNL